MAKLAATAMQMPNLRMPTGYESEQRKIEAKRRIAQAMFEQGIAPQNISNWTQVLAKLAQTWVGKSEDKKATKMEGAMYDRMHSDLVGKISKLQQMRDAGATNQQIVDAFLGDPMMADYIKGNQEAIDAGLKNREGLTNFGGRVGVRIGDVAGQYDPGKVTDAVRQRPDGTGYINPLASAAAQLHQLIPADDASAQMLQNMTFNPDQASAGQPGATPQSPNMLDISKLNPEERSVLSGEIQRRAGLPPEAANMPQANPLTPPPSKVINGKPYWSVNGQWYDNPEGK